MSEDASAMKLRILFLLLMLASKLPNLSTGGKKNFYHKLKELSHILNHINGYKENYNKIISGQPCEDEGELCDQLSMLCHMDKIANVCRKTCGKCNEPSTGTSTTEKTINVEETSTPETLTSVAGILFILQNNTFSKKHHISIYISLLSIFCFYV